MGPVLVYPGSTHIKAISAGPLNTTQTISLHLSASVGLQIRRAAPRTTQCNSIGYHAAHSAYLSSTRVQTFAPVEMWEISRFK